MLTCWVSGLKGWWLVVILPRWNGSIIERRNGFAQWELLGQDDLVIRRRRRGVLAVGTIQRPFLASAPVRGRRAVHEVGDVGAESPVISWGR